MTGGRTGRQVAVLCTVGLTRRLLDEMPHVRSVGEQGFTARLDTVFPAVTATVQATLTTGSLPREHGAVANGWYHRDQGEVMMWRQHNGLVHGEKVWQAARRRDPEHSTAYLCWWWAMGADVDTVLTPAPSTITTAASPRTATPSRPPCATNSRSHRATSRSSSTGARPRR